MSYSVVWIALPNGFAENGRARLSLVASPRPETGAGTLAGSPLADWPGQIIPLLRDPIPLRVATHGSTDLTPVTLESALPDPALWRALFPATTPVDARGRGGAALSRIEPAASFVDAAQSIDDIYTGTGGGGGATASLAPDHPAARALATLAEITMDPVRRPARGRSAAVDAVAPIADYAAALRSVQTTAVGPGPLAGIRKVDVADFHQVVGLLLNHPVLALALGLRVDVQLPAFDGERTIRVVTADGRALNGPIVRPQPWSRVSAQPDAGRFTMATQPGADIEVAGGMLDTAATNRYLVSTTDVAALSLQLVGLAAARAAAVAQRVAASALSEPAPLRLPVRRDVGFTVAQAKRFETTVAHAKKRAQAFDNLTGALDGAPVLFADDVTTGYRVDVSTGGPFRSLMRRLARYRIGNRTLTDDGEGKVEAIVGVQQDATLKVSEQLWSWNGWALAAPKPGPKALGVAENGATTAPAASQPAKGYDLHIDVSAVPGTVPRLRFGRSYRFRARTVDLAGNSIVPDRADPARVLPALPYLRKEAAPPPAAVPRKRFTLGESHLHWVVRSDGDGRPVGLPCQRHLVPPKASQHLAELHGMFDPAFGRNATAAAVTAQLQVALRESGSLLDPTVPGPDGLPVPAPGIAYVSNDPTAPKIVVRPRPGEALPNGYYVVHDTDAMRTPYLADPVAAGAALIGLPGQARPVVVPYPTGRWPEVMPVRLVVSATFTPGVTATVKIAGGRPTLGIGLPPGVRVDAELSTALRVDRLAQLDVGGAAQPDLRDGLVLGLSARQPVSMVHAVRKPITAPAFTGTGPTIEILGAATTVRLSAQVSAHRPTTSKVDLVARWTEVADTGEGDILSEPRTATAGSALVDPTGGDLTFTGTQHFGDLRHRRIDYTLVGTTRFREYFDAVPDGDPSLQREGAAVTKSIPNRTVPPPPDVHSVVPTFRWTRSFDPDTQQFTSTRRIAGVRVYLRRKWLVTGEGEQLGVVVHTTEDDAKRAVEKGRRVQDFVSQWGADPLVEDDDLVWDPLLPELFADDAPRTVMTLTDPAAFGTAGPNDPDPPPPSVTVVGHPVAFDPDRGLWFADVDLRISATAWPFVRLAVVRFQPDSEPGRAISRVVRTDHAQLPPRRALVAWRVGKFGVRVEILGIEDPHSRFQMRQERRMPNPLDPAHDLGSSIGVGPTAVPENGVATADGWRLTDLGPFDGAIGRLVLDRAPGAPEPSDDVVAQLRAGRVVVEEHQTGFAVLGPDTTTRVVWTDVFDRNIIGIGTGGTP